MILNASHEKWDGEIGYEYRFLMCVEECDFMVYIFFDEK